MNKKIVNLSMIALYLILASLIGCNSKPKQSALKVGVIIGPALAKQVDIVKSAAQAVCNDTGRGVVFIKTVKSEQAGEFQQTANSLFKQEESSTSIVGLVIGANCSVDLKPMIRSAVITGHPVILFNCDEPESKRDAYVGIDNILAGKMLGKAVADSAGTSTRVIVLITGDETILMYRQRASAIRSQINLSANLNIIKTIVNKNKNMEESASKLAEFLSRTPNVYAIVSTGNWIFMPAYEKALANYNGKLFAISNTPEAIEAVKSGRVAALVVGDLYSQVYDATHLCLMRLQNQIIASPKPLKPFLVTQDNIKNFIRKWGKVRLVEKEAQKAEQK